MATVMAKNENLIVAAIVGVFALLLVVGFVGLQAAGEKVQVARQAEQEKVAAEERERERQEQERARLAAEQRDREKMERLAVEQRERERIAEEKRIEEEKRKREEEAIAEQKRKEEEEAESERERLRLAAEKKKEEERIDELKVQLFNGDMQAREELWQLISPEEREKIEVARFEGANRPVGAQARAMATPARQPRLTRQQMARQAQLAAEAEAWLQQERRRGTNNSGRPQMRSSATMDYYNISPYGGQSRMSGYSEIPNPFGGTIRSDFRIDTDVQFRNGRWYGTSNLVIE